MKVDTLKIERRPSYDSDFPNQLVGMVTIVSDGGTQSIKLTNRTLAKLFEVIKADVVEQSRINAATVGRAIDAAATEPLLEGAMTIGLLGEEPF